MRKGLTIFYYSGIVLFFLSFSSVGNCAEKEGRIYDEYETVAGDIIGIGGTGASVASQVSAIRINPALISAGRIYSLEGSYNRSSFGGDFYQVGVIDNKTSAVAAGFLFSEFMDSVYTRMKEDKDDAPIKRRFYLGLAMGNEKVSAGLAANYTEAVDYSNIEGSNDQNKVPARKKGFTFVSPGIFVSVIPQFRLGLSVENLFNGSLKQYNPRVYRFGMSYHYIQETFKLAINLDYKVRERIQKERANDPEIKNNLEHMVFLGGSTIFSDIIKIMVGYGREISGKRTSLSYGISLMKDNSSLSFGSLYPYFNKVKDTHLGFNLSYALKF